MSLYIMKKFNNYFINNDYYIIFYIVYKWINIYQPENKLTITSGKYKVNY